jgi:glycerophosphoryl diester phosphodiesterase
LLRIKAKGLAFLALTALPLAILGALTYVALLSRHDINYYLADRPPSFLAALAIGGILGAVFLAVLSYAYVRTVFLFPIILYEDRSPEAALSESLRRTKGHFRRLGTVLLSWQLGGFLLSMLAIQAFTLIAGMLLHLVEARFWALVPLVALLLAAHGALLALVSFVLIGLHCVLIISLYRERSTPEEDFGAHELGSPPVPLDAPRIRSLLRFWKVGVLVSLAVFVGLCVSVFRRLDTPQHVIVTAHKGFSWAAPENSLTAIRRAIDVGADYAEIDVQETADGEIILNHDRDLMRVAGVPGRVRQMTLAEIKRADLGSRIGPQFAGERIPTLKEVIATARDRIKLQIELKFYDKDRKLAGDVARLIAREKFESQCVVSSLHYDGLLEVRRANPRIRTAAIVTFSIGDIDRLEVDGVSVNARYLTNRLIRAVRARHKDLYAWTVDDPRQMISLIERGVPNIVTNRPDLLVALRREFASLGDFDRRLLAARYLLGLEPKIDASGETSSTSPDDLDQP